MDDPVTLWFNPRCSNCRTADALLNERGVDVREVHYLVDPPGRATLERVMEQLGIDDPREILRAKEPVYGELGLADAGRDELLDAMVAHPILIQRPIAIRGDRAVVARPPDRVLELLE
ncbi:MAG TPA: arsenate reductase (glutaredoxin) [Egibacteraceae bacterium]|jgi:arsenate reductase (glutaredoxin)|nr:arsenate reductase (glutaredoxin) [Egibacteraceae bacterium]